MVGDAVELRRNATRMQSVGMMFGRQRPVGDHEIDVVVRHFFDKAAAADAVSIAMDPTAVPKPLGQRAPQLVKYSIETVELAGKLTDTLADAAAAGAGAALPETVVVEDRLPRPACRAGMTTGILKRAAGVRCCRRAHGDPPCLHRCPPTCRG